MSINILFKCMQCLLTFKSMHSLQLHHENDCVVKQEICEIKQELGEVEVIKQEIYEIKKESLKIGKKNCKGKFASLTPNVEDKKKVEKEYVRFTVAEDQAYLKEREEDFAKFKNKISMISSVRPKVCRIASSILPANRKLQEVFQQKKSQKGGLFVSTQQTPNFCKMATLQYLDQNSAAALDQELFTEYKFSVDQLMELAGQACAHAVAKVYPVEDDKQVLIVCGPGNNGGDGLVCARHLKLLGYASIVVYPKETKNTLYLNLITQCEKFDIPVLKEMPILETVNSVYHLIVDAVFGFSFKPPVRPNFLPILNTMVQCNIPVVSVDIPSGWDVNNGPPDNSTDTPALAPDMLISLTAPKIAAKFFKGQHHILGGRFVPPAVANKYQLNLPNYPELSQVVVLK